MSRPQRRLVLSRRASDSSLASYSPLAIPLPSCLWLRTWSGTGTPAEALHILPWWAAHGKSVIRSLDPTWPMERNLKTCHSQRWQAGLLALQCSMGLLPVHCPTDATGDLHAMLPFLPVPNRHELFPQEAPQKHYTQDRILPTFPLPSLLSHPRKVGWVMVGGNRAFEEALGRCPALPIGSFLQNGALGHFSLCFEPLLPFLGHQEKSQSNS